MSEQTSPTEQATPDGTTSHSTRPSRDDSQVAGYAETEVGALARQNPVSAAIVRMSIWQLTLVIVIVVFAWQWFDMHRQVNGMQHLLAQRLAEMDGNNKANQVLVTQGQESVRELSAKLALLEARFSETQNQRAALESLYQELSRSRDETALAEVEQMLLIAGQQLQLSANVKAALIAMQQADDYLKRMDRASLNGLRKAIGSDMDKLRVLPEMSLSDMNARLDSLIALVDTLPLAQEISPAPQDVKIAPGAAQENAWQKLLREMWHDAKQLVRIENTQRQEFPLLSPTQTFFLRENLKLRLLSARLALSLHDETRFKHDLQLAQVWVGRYFDVRSNAGGQAAASLKKLHASSITLEMPDISASLVAVRAYRASHEKTAR